MGGLGGASAHPKFLMGGAEPPKIRTRVAQIVANCISDTGSRFQNFPGKDPETPKNASLITCMSTSAPQI